MAVTAVYVPVDKILWTVFFHQASKRLKATVAEIIGVIESGSRRMCEGNICTAVQKLKAQAVYTALHLPLRVLVRTAGIFHRPAKAEDGETLYLYESAVNTVRPFGWAGGIAAVVIAVINPIRLAFLLNSVWLPLYNRQLRQPTGSPHPNHLFSLPKYCNPEGFWYTLSKVTWGFPPHNIFS